MAEGRAAPLPYLSQLDPGVGKTQTAVHFIRALLQSTAHKHIAVLYCVSTLDEIAKLIGDLGPVGHEVGVYTADKEYNDLGRKKPNEARVLITTQQMVDSRVSRAKRFADLQEFTYYGVPRAVKIWDESLLPAEELTLNTRALQLLPHFLQKISDKLATRIEDICAEVRKLKDGSVYTFFDPVAEFGIEYAQVHRRLRKEPQARIRETGKTVWQLAGKDVRIRRDNLNDGHIMLDYRNHLPDDFWPVVILDASGRVRGTYPLWQENRSKGVVKLTEAQKKYSNLAVHLWTTGGGKDAWRRKSSMLLDGIVATINSKPLEKWLVVVHKEDDWEDYGQQRIGDLEKTIRDLVKEPQSLHFLTWGNAHATNDFRMCTNVILAGTLFYPAGVYEVRARAAMGLPAAEELAEKNYRTLELGEHMHLILQAACRGSARKCIGDDCAPMELYVIASKRSGIPDVLPDVFPGCTMHEWKPVEKPLRGMAKRLIDDVQANLGQTPGSLLSMREVWQRLGIADKSNFNRTKRSPEVLEAFQANGIDEVSVKGSSRITHFRRAA
jgi:hypothetical protein